MITKSGFPPGRPRKGERRPTTDSMIRARDRYARRSKDPLFRQALAQKQAKWRAKNPERNREIALNARHREKLWAMEAAVIETSW